MSEKQKSGIIGLRTAVVLYCLLMVVAAYSLKGTWRLAVLVVIALLVAKSCVHYLRDRLDSR